MQWPRCTKKKPFSKMAYGPKTNKSNNQKINQDKAMADADDASNYSDEFEDEVEETPAAAAAAAAEKGASGGAA